MINTTTCFSVTMSDPESYISKQIQYKTQRKIVEV